MGTVFSANPLENGSKFISGARDTALPRRIAHSGSQGQTRGISVGVFVSRYSKAGGSGCARLQRASASSGVAAPQGCVKPILELRKLSRFIRSVVVYALTLWYNGLKR